MDHRRSSLGVTESIGTFLLLIITVSLFSVIYVTVLSDEGPTPFIKSDIVSTVEGLNIVLEHRGGNPMSLDTNITLTIGPYSKTIHPRGNLSNNNSDDLWNVGERVVIPFTDIRPATCMYGSPALDYELAEEINVQGGGGGSEAAFSFSNIVKNYTGPTNLSKLDVNIQWSSGSTIANAMAIDPEKNAIEFMGPIELHHLLEYQEWELAPGVSSINLRFEFVEGKAGHINTFMYYFNRDSTTKKLVTKPIGNLTNNITIDTKHNTSIGFGIKSEDSSSHHIDYWYTNIPMNGNGMKQALVYDLGKTTLGPNGSYLIGFEDLDRSIPPGQPGHSDSDFQDLIVIVHVVSYK